MKALTFPSSDTAPLTGYLPLYNPRVSRYGGEVCELTFKDLREPPTNFHAEIILRRDGDSCSVCVKAFPKSLNGTFLKPDDNRKFCKHHRIPDGQTRVFPGGHLVVFGNGDNAPCFRLEFPNAVPQQPPNNDPPTMNLSTLFEQSPSSQPSPKRPKKSSTKATEATPAQQPAPSTATRTAVVTEGCGVLAPEASRDVGDQPHSPAATATTAVTAASGPATTVANCKVPDGEAAPAAAPSPSLSPSPSPSTPPSPSPSPPQPPPPLPPPQSPEESRSSEEETPEETPDDTPTDQISRVGPTQDPHVISQVVRDTQCDTQDSLPPAFASQHPCTGPPSSQEDVQDLDALLRERLNERLDISDLWPGNPPANWPPPIAQTSGLSASGKPGPLWHLARELQSPPASELP